MTNQANKIRKVILTIAGIILLIAIAVLINGPLTDAKLERIVREETRGLSMMPTADDHTPAFHDAEGTMYRLKGFSGKPLVLNIWATWCPPCIKEMPALAALEKQYKNKIQVIAVSVDAGGFAEIEAFFAKHPITHPRLFHDADMKLFKHLRLRGLPTTFIINAEGQTVAKMERIFEKNDQEVLAVLDTLADASLKPQIQQPDK